MPTFRRNHTLTYFLNFANALQGCSSINLTLYVLLNWWHGIISRCFPVGSWEAVWHDRSVHNQTFQHNFWLTRSWSKISSPARNGSVYKTCCGRDRSHGQGSKTHPLQSPRSRSQLTRRNHLLYRTATLHLCTLTFAGMCLYSVLVTGITNVVNQWEKKENGIFHLLPPKHPGVVVLFWGEKEKHRSIWKQPPDSSISRVFLKTNRVKTGKFRYRHHKNAFFFFFFSPCWELLEVFTVSTTCWALKGCTWASAGVC